MTRRPQSAARPTFTTAGTGDRVAAGLKSRPFADHARNTVAGHDKTPPAGDESGNGRAGIPPEREAEILKSRQEHAAARAPEEPGTSTEG